MKLKKKKKKKMNWIEVKIQTMESPCRLSFAVTLCFTGQDVQKVKNERVTKPCLPCITYRKYTMIRYGLRARIGWDQLPKLYCVLQKMVTALWQYDWIFWLQTCSRDWLTCLEGGAPKTHSILVSVSSFLQLRGWLVLCCSLAGGWVTDGWTQALCCAVQCWIREKE
jgi:hypothetical protein